MRPFVHHIDPVIAEFSGIYLWWYGLSYTLGFLGLFLWLWRARNRLRMSLAEVYDITLLIAVGVLLGGRLIEVFCYEWTYYANHVAQIPAYWLGGMATHGLLLGATLSTLLFCWRHKKSFLSVADDLSVPGAWIMGAGRVGNFIDGQISGAVSDIWWAVKFPDIEGPRHPVVLYDGLKNLCLIPLLLWIRRRYPYKGILFAHFVFWYSFLRIFVDLFREYRVDTLGVGTGQIINIVMSLLGLALMVWFHFKKYPISREANSLRTHAGSNAYVRLWPRRVFLALLLLFCLIIPSDWTQDIPKRYGDRHPGLNYSLLYPHIDN